MTTTERERDDARVLIAIRSAAPLGMETYQLQDMVGLYEDRWAQGKNRNIDNALRRLKARGIIRFDRNAGWTITPGTLIQS